MLARAKSGIEFFDLDMNFFERIFQQYEILAACLGNSFPFRFLQKLAKSRSYRFNFNGSNWT